MQTDTSTLYSVSRFTHKTSLVRIHVVTGSWISFRVALRLTEDLAVGLKCIQPLLSILYLHLNTAPGAYNVAIGECHFNIVAFQTS